MNELLMPDSVTHTTVIGLTGQTGAGKTTVSRQFADSGFSVIDADAVSRRVVEPNTPCLTELCECFSDDILLPDGTMNRKHVAEIAFSDPKKKEVLNSVMFPYITNEILLQIRTLAEQGHTLILLDAPTLFESHADDFCSLVIAVIARPEIRMARIVARDMLTTQQALSRMEAQLPEAYLIAHSDFVIQNNGDAAMLAAMTAEAIDKIKKYHRQHELLESV